MHCSPKFSVTKILFRFIVAIGFLKLAHSAWNNDDDDEFSGKKTCTLPNEGWCTFEFIKTGEGKWFKYHATTSDSSNLFDAFFLTAEQYSSWANSLPLCTALDDTNSGAPSYCLNLFYNQSSTAYIQADSCTTGVSDCDKEVSVPANENDFYVYLVIAPHGGVQPSASYAINCEFAWDVPHSWLVMPIVSVGGFLFAAIAIYCSLKQGNKNTKKKELEKLESEIQLQKFV